MSKPAVPGWPPVCAIGAAGPLTAEVPLRASALSSALQTSLYCLVTPDATRIPGEHH
jgi:hypothetical protein